MFFFDVNGISSCSLFQKSLECIVVIYDSMKHDMNLGFGMNTKWDERYRDVTL